MSPLVLLEIVCLQEHNRERFDLLQNSAQGWGVKRLRFASSDALGLLCIREFGPNQVIVVIGEFAFLSGQAGKRNDYVTLILASGVTQDQIILLEGSETPEQIENLVREKLSKLLETPFVSTETAAKNEFGVAYKDYPHCKNPCCPQDNGVGLNFIGLRDGENPYTRTDGGGPYYCYACCATF